MKKHLLFFGVIVLAVMGMTLTSCGDDNDEPSGGSSSLVGSWSFELDEGWNNIIGDYIDEDFFQYLQLKSNGSFVQVQPEEEEPDGYYIARGNWSESNGKLILEYTSGELKGTTWTYDIIKKEKNRVTISIWGITGYMIRISDNVVEQYLH